MRRAGSTACAWEGRWGNDELGRSRAHHNCESDRSGSRRGDYSPIYRIAGATRVRGRWRYPGQAARRSSAAFRCPRTHRSVFPRAGTNSRRCANTRAREPPLAFADCDGAFLVEVAVAAERREIKFQRFGLNEPSSGHVVDYKMGEIRLSSYRAQHGELRCREAHGVGHITVGIRHSVEHGFIGRCRCRSGLPQIGQRR